MSRYRARWPRRRRTAPRWPRAAFLPRPAELLRRPAELVARVRWLFALSALAALVVTPVGILVGGSTWSVAMVAAACAGLATSWVFRYRRRRTPPVLDVLDALCVLLLALAGPQPAIAFGVVVPALWFRSAYGSNARVTAYTAGMCVAMTLALPLWGIVPGQAAATAAAPVLGSLPVIVINAIVARHLALGLFERERDLERDAALAAMAHQLIGVTDRDLVVAATWVTAEAICRSSAGLRAVVVYDDGAETLGVAGSAGSWRWRPERLPRACLPSGAVSGEAVAIDAPAELVRASGVSGEWVCLALPDAPGAHLLLGAASRVPAEGIVATRSMLGQAALAVRTCDAHEALRVQARTDGLTGLANRAAFTAAMSEVLAAPSAAESWVLFLDLDDFKVVNDQLGHLAGDRLLARLGRQLTEVLRAEDLCARLGGDEFAVLLRGATEADACRIGQRLVELTSTPVQLAEGLARIGASVGATRVLPGSSNDLVVHQADVAMYAAKAAGKNRVQLFHPGLLTVDDRAAAESELRAAIEGGDLVLAYQPVVSAAGGRCTAVEALVRWQHPDRGLLGPGTFLDLAEESGAIIALGERVLRSACADAASWADEEAPVSVHVNASATQLAHPHFVDLVRASLADAGLAPHLLVVEVTETTVLDSPAVSATLDELVRLGVGIALDDFGTGYAALTTLRSLPIDIVKIDKSFVAGALTQAADAAVVEAIVQMADRLGLETVAEGVESAEQQAFLESAGITALQGFLYLPPAPVAEFTDWLAENRRRAELAPT